MGESEGAGSELQAVQKEKENGCAQRLNWAGAQLRLLRSKTNPQNITHCNMRLYNSQDYSKTL